MNSLCIVSVLFLCVISISLVCCVTVSITIHHHFNGYNGKDPDGGLVYYSQSNSLYGVTGQGANDYPLYGDGVLYKINVATKQFTQVYNFTKPTGRIPTGISLGTDGNFYGQAFNGGANGK